MAKTHQNTAFAQPRPNLEQMESTEGKMADDAAGLSVIPAAKLARTVMSPANLLTAANVNSMPL